jgi:hypothetical protein
VADFFCGSGTLPLVALRHNRRFIAADVSWRAIHTTRARLIEKSRTPYVLYRESTAIIPTNHLDCPVFVSNQTVSLIDPPDLDYWEIDPAWDGKIFHSAMQARRSNRSTEIPLEIIMPTPPTNVCVRAVTVDGSIFQS